MSITSGKGRELEGMPYTGSAARDWLQIMASDKPALIKDNPLLMGASLFVFSSASFLGEVSLKEW
jgi:hypothetical protein